MVDRTSVHNSKTSGMSKVNRKNLDYLLFRFNIFIFLFTVCTVILREDQGQGDQECHSTEFN